MPTNTEIENGFHVAMSSLGLPHPVAFEAVESSKIPMDGYLLEPSFFPNRGDQPGLANNAAEFKEGIFQINVYARPGNGAIKLSEEAQRIVDGIPRGLRIVENVRVTRIYIGSRLKEPDKIYMPVVIEYAG